MDRAETPAAIEFGRFRVLPHRREVLAEGRPLDLGARAFDVLMALIEVSGAVVSKDALMNRVWPDRIVEENSLQAQIAALRRAFAADRDLIRTIAGRGYQFTGAIRTVAASLDGQASVGIAHPTSTPSRPPTNLPEPVSELIGRDAELDEILDLSASHRLVTLTGAGGIGKTRLGFEATRHLLPRFADGVWAIELAPLSDPELVPVTVATALGLELASGTASPVSVATVLRAKQLLLVLDNCEHVVDAAARMAEALLRANPAVRVIATSREPLRAEGEWVYPVPPLAVPAEGSPDGEDPLRYGAVRLFVERVRAATPHFLSGARDLAAIAGMCRRLDGIPLAIELAAARAAALGIESVAARLDDRFRLLAGGYRTATPRHRTLRATMDWSYELLTEPERVVLRRLAIFSGGFTLQAARAVVADDEIAPSEVVDCVASLVAKSLVTADTGGATMRYRLLETTRAYALEKLVQAGEFDAAARRHARRYLELFEGAEIETETRPAAEWLADYGPRIDNLRAALDWALSPAGDPSIGVALTAAAVPLWVHLSLMGEYRGRIDKALAAIRAGSGGDLRSEMKLHAALAGSLIFAEGAVPEIGSAWAKVLEIAEALDDDEYRLRAMSGLWNVCNDSGEYRGALLQAQKIRSLTEKRPDPTNLLISERMIAVSRYFLGDYPSARQGLEHVLAEYVPSDRRAHIIRFQFDLRLRTLAPLARVLWAQGFAEQAMSTAQDSLEYARAIDHANSLCYSLALATCPIALLVGDLAAADDYVTMLLDLSTTHALARWRACGLSYRGALVSRRGDVMNGLHLLREGFDKLDHDWFAAFNIAVLRSEALGRAGQTDDGLAEVDKAIARCERTEGRWLISELLRIKGELLLLQGGSKAAAVAEDHFRRALDWASRQGALSWELRAATSLAWLLRDRGHSADALAVLQPVYDRFTEGFATADLKAAKALLDTLL
jgi:predicted ATPase